ncbi:MAG: DNA polymerase III subunit gamma/tau [Lachnospiraceae bacterium]|nr:DNA polymerase III subunit gamma/tau [Lachnospiraceae bacterium]
MSYTALYRKFRPATFEDVKGQDHIVTTLRNQIRSDMTQHAYLFTGTRGTGKTSVAKLFAKAINCEHPVNQNPCMECSCCKAIQSGVSMNVVEIDAASNNGVDNIRQIIDEVAYAPTEGRYKVYIIDEVHMLSTGAFNALLKTLEEPPSYVVFILATTEVYKLPITILSRCQRYDFRRISVSDISERINELLPLENVEADEDAVRYVAKAADGSLRDALSLLDQCIAFNFGKRLTYDMVLDTLGAVNSEIFSRMLRIIICGDVSGAIRLLEEVIMDGRELGQFVSDLTWYVRNILLAITSDDVSAVVDMSRENLALLLEEASQVKAEEAMRYIRILSELSNQIRYAANKRVLTELAIVKMCKPETEADTDSLNARIEAIEAKLENGFYTTSAPARNEEAPSVQAEAEPKMEQLPDIEDVPADVKTVVQNWRNVISSFGYPEFTFLKQAVPSLGPSGELVVVFQTRQAYSFFTEGENAEKKARDFKDRIKKLTGGEVTVRLEAGKQIENPDAGAPADLRKIIEEKLGDLNILIKDEKTGEVSAPAADSEETETSDEAPAEASTAQSTPEAEAPAEAAEGDEDEYEFEEFLDDEEES